MRAPRPALAPGHLPLRASAPARRARQPLRGAGPADAAQAGTGPRAFPPAYSLGLCAPLRGSVALAAPAVPTRAIRFAAGFRWSPLRRFGAGRFLAWVAGPPLARPLWGFGPGWLRAPGGSRAFGPRSFGFASRGFSLRGVHARRAFCLVALCVAL